MKRTWLSVAAGALVCMLASTSAEAQGLKFNVGAGLTMPTGDYGDFSKTGWHALGGLNLSLPAAPVDIRVDGLYSRTGIDGVTGNTKVIGAMGNVVYTLGPGVAPVKPYVLGGLGIHNVKISSGGSSVDETKVSFGGGVGLTFGFGGAALFVETRYMSVQTSGASTTFFPVTAGLRIGG